MALQQTITQPFLQESIHAPFFRQGVGVEHAVVDGVTGTTPPAAGDDLTDLCIMVHAYLHVRCRKAACFVMKIISEIERGRKLAAFDNSQMQIKLAVDTRNYMILHNIEIGNQVSQEDVIAFIQFHQPREVTRGYAVVCKMSLGATHV